MLEAVILSTLTGSVICLALLIFKNKILSLLGGRALYYISLSAMLLFVLPLNIGYMSFTKIQAKQMLNVSEFEAAAPAVENTDSKQESSQASQAELQKNVLPRTTNMVRRSTPVTMQEILLAIWLLGFVASACRYFISYFRFKRKICSFEIYENIDGVEVIKSPLVSSPLVFGFFKPTLAIPEIEMNEDDYSLAVKHEMVHYKRHDSWFKLFAVAVNSVCWFNPITYFMLNLIGEACEYACDEQVVKEMNAAERRQYSEMILSMVCQTSPALSSNMVRSKKQLKRRFERIMKKESFSMLRAVLCTAAMLILLGGSVALANEAAPIVSSLLRDDYVYVSTYGNGAYNELAPVEKNGVYYLPFREFLNNSNVENNKIKYENDTITVDVWTNEMTMVSVVSSPNEQRREDRHTTPAEYSWSTVCKIGSCEVEIAGEKYTLNNAPYIENGITYVPYEYLRKLQLYENKCFFAKSREQRETSKFTTMMMFGFDSGKARFYTDYAQLGYMRNSYDDFVYMVYNAEAEISKTGYRTKFELSCDYFDVNNSEREGDVSVKLNKVTRIYSKGSDIEGLFTVVRDGEVIYDNEKGYITGLPIPAGDGVPDIGVTKVKVGEMQLDVFFDGFDCVTEEYDEKAREAAQITELSDTVQKGIVPAGVKLNGVNVLRGSKVYNHLRYNADKGLIDLNIEFDDYNGAEEDEIRTYRIHSEIGSKMTVIDKNTISAELYFSDRSDVRIDSFSAIITIADNGSFELKSTDGKYIVRGTAEEYVPQWQWSEEQKNAPVPQVTLINE